LTEISIPLVLSEHKLIEGPYCTLTVAKGSMMMCIFILPG
jgi:hypothetical protein